MNDSRESRHGSMDGLGIILMISILAAGGSLGLPRSCEKAQPEKAKPIEMHSLPRDSTSAQYDKSKGYQAGIDKIPHTESGKSSAQQQANPTRLQNVEECLQNLQFAKAHEQILICLQEAQPEAHFMLARLLLLEFKWARRTYVQEASQTAADKEALKREVPYQGIIRLHPQKYRLVAPYFRQFTPKDFYTQEGAAWDQFDYLRLITTELHEYLALAEPGSANVTIAREWLSLLERIVEDDPYAPYPLMIGPPSIELVKQRLNESVVVLKAIEAGQLIVQ